MPYTRAQTVRGPPVHYLTKRLLRQLVRFASLFLSEDRSRALERWRRGREEFRKRGLADAAVVSYGKSGRTWLRVMLSRYYQLAHDLPDNIIIGFDNFHRLDPAVPRLFFTHDNYLRDYTGHRDSKRDFYDLKTVLLVRRPQDVAVSQYFQWKFRMRAHKKDLNRYPAHGADLTPYEFVMDPHQGLPHIIDFMNLWAAELPKLRDVLVVRYEDLRAEPVDGLGRILGFLGEAAKPERVAQAVEFASVENLRTLERDRHFWRSGSRMTPRDPANPDSFKVRRAVVGGYRDYFDDEQLARIDAMVRDRLSPDFGYDSAPAAADQRDEPGNSSSSATANAAHSAAARKADT